MENVLGIYGKHRPMKCSARACLAGVVLGALLWGCGSSSDSADSAGQAFSAGVQPPQIQGGSVPQGTNVNFGGSQDTGP